MNLEYKQSQRRVLNSVETLQNDSNLIIFKHRLIYLENLKRQWNFEKLN